MNKQTFDVNKLRVAAPCPVSWDSMKGDERQRFCDLCKLDVYNFSEMTADEVRKLFAASPGRICGKLYRRTDGTILTKDCPVGTFRAARQKTARLASAALAAVLGFFSAADAQTKSKDVCIVSQQAKIERFELKNQESKITGVVRDENGAVIPGLSLTLIDESTQRKISAVADENGEFILKNLPEGKYTFQAEGAGWKKYETKGLQINRNEKIELKLTLRVDQNVTVLLGVIAEEPLIDLTSSGITTTITREMIDRIPHEK